jgi:hypothetical protein
MGELKKAYIVEISSDSSAKELSRRFPVQFNPNSLRLQMSSTLAQGTPPGSQQRESTGGATTTLSLELVFDTADEGTTGSPRSVREKTAQIERFVFPKSQSEDQQKQPKLRFQWGTFVIEGVASSVNVDLEHFAADGTPLRAKVSLSIAEQNRKQVFLAAGPGSNQKGNAPSPMAAASASIGASAGLGVSGGLGISGGAGIGAGIGASGGFGVSAGASAQVGVALDGESLPEFSARVGLDPTAWRGLDTGGGAGLSGALSLEAGSEIGFSAGLNASAGLGVTLGAEAGATASLEASFGLDASGGLDAVAGVGAGAGLSAGFSLAAAGGLTAAIEAVQIVRSKAAEQQARTAFTPPFGASAAPAATATAAASAAPVPPAAAPRSPAAGIVREDRARPAAPDQVRRPLTLTGIPSPSQQQAAPAAPPPPRADARATSFGFGVPLRSTVGAAALERSNALLGAVPLRERLRDARPPLSSDPTVPPWKALPDGERGPAGADRVQRARRPGHRCGCAGRCRGGH